MENREKQNSMALHQRLILGFGAVNLVTLVITMISVAVMARLHTAGSVSTGFLAGFSGGVAALAALSVVLSVFACRRLEHSMTRPLKILNGIATQLSLGDTSANVMVLTNDEIGRLMQAFKTMVESTRRQALAAETIAKGDLTTQVALNSDKDVLGLALNHIAENNSRVLSSIRAASDEIAAEAGQISEAGTRLAEGSSRQAGSIQELAAAVEQVKSNIDLSAQHAAKARTRANKVSLDAEDGSGRMSEMLEAMDEIGVSSTNISGVMKAIETIAFQTNILSLNASVEAARAGQYGKGFAVVADEVRNLAARSAKAAQETADMVKDSVQRIEHGTRIARETADAFHKIVDGIREVADLAEKIADAAAEQAAGVSAINDEIGLVSAAVQANSAATEESSTSTVTLYQQAEELKALVQTFKLRLN